MYYIGLYLTFEVFYRAFLPGSVHMLWMVICQLPSDSTHMRQLNCQLLHVPWLSQGFPFLTCDNAYIIDLLLCNKSLYLEKHKIETLHVLFLGQP